MPHRVIDRIRQKILLREYAMTVHAMEEMAEDDLDIFDIEEAFSTGESYGGIRRIPEERNIRSKGYASDRERLVGVVGRFHGADSFRIITVYEITKVH